MDSKNVTLGQLFTLPNEQTAAGTEKLKQMEEKLGKEIRKVQWKASMPDLAEKIAKLLDVPITDGWIRSWKKAEEVDKALKDSEKAPNDTIELELAEHTIKSTLHPYISVRVGKFPAKKIQFDVVLSCKLKAFMLTIRGGAIREIKAGQCEGQGTFEYDHLVLATYKPNPIPLPLTIPVEA